MTDDQKKDIRKIFKHFGFTGQFAKMIEEFEEYKEAINIYLSDPTEENLDNLIFEKADLEIMINQLMYGTINMKNDITTQNIDSINNRARKWKIKRTLERIDERYYEGER